MKLPKYLIRTVATILIALGALIILYNLLYLFQAKKINPYYIGFDLKANARGKKSILSNYFDEKNNDLS